jgi:hypothetical protein
MSDSDASPRGQPAAAPSLAARAVAHAGRGLALAGGVVEGGFYEVGVLCALEEAVGGLASTRSTCTWA